MANTQRRLTIDQKGYTHTHMRVFICTSKTHEWPVKVAYKMAIASFMPLK